MLFWHVYRLLIKYSQEIGWIGTFISPQKDFIPSVDAHRALAAEVGGRGSGYVDDQSRCYRKLVDPSDGRGDYGATRRIQPRNDWLHCPAVQNDTSPLPSPPLAVLALARWRHYLLLVAVRVIFSFCFSLTPVIASDVNKTKFFSPRPRPPKVNKGTWWV